MLILNGEKQGSGIDTSDATATDSDILNGKTAYVDGEEITGTCAFDADTSDATAAAADISSGKTAYVSGSKITGNMAVTAVVFYNPTYSYTVKDASENVVSSGSGESDGMLRNLLNSLASQVGYCAKAIMSTANFGDGYISRKSLEGVINGSTADIRRSMGWDPWVLVGTGSSNDNIDAYSLTTPASAGWSIGTSATTSTFNAETRILTTTMTRTFANASGSEKLITEAGFACYDSGGTDVLYVRDVFDAISVPNGDTLTWTYTTKVQM